MKKRRLKGIGLFLTHFAFCPRRRLYNRKQFIVIFSSKYFDIRIMINGQVDLGTIFPNL